MAGNSEVSAQPQYNAKAQSNILLMPVSVVKRELREFVGTPCYPA